MADIRVALAAIAAIVGAGFASGREIAAFFTNHGPAGWTGAAFCCLMTAALTTMLVKLAKREKAATLPQLYTRVMGAPCGETMQVAYSLLLVVVGAAMCSAAGDLGAIALHSRYARAAGTAFSLAVALLFARGTRALAKAGAALAALTLGYYAFLCRLPADQARIANRFPRTPDDSVAVSLLMGALYAALNTTLAGGVICRAGAKAEKPLRAGLYTGGLMALLLIPACRALLAFGATDAALPSVAMAALWGEAGYIASVLILFCGITTTLTATLGCLKEQLLLAGLPERACLPCAVAATLILSYVGFSAIVNIGYPLLGFLCACMLPMLAVFL